MNSPYGLPAECDTCHLRSGDFFCTLEEETRHALNRIKHVEVVPQGTVIFAEGQTPRGVLMLCHGSAKLSTTSRDGKTFILRIAKPGQVLGLHAIVAGTPHELTAETMEPCQLNFVEGGPFLRFLTDHSDACLQAARHISRDCHDAYDVVRSLGLSRSVSGRIAKFLLASATDGHVADGVVHATLTLTHEDIAQSTGTSRETITRILSEFRRKAIVELRGSALIIHNRPELERLVAA